MKKIFNLLLLSAILTAIPEVAHSQDGQACFMLDANGKPMDLSYLCSSNSNTNSSRNSNLNSTSNTRYSSGVYSVPIKRRHAGIPVIDVKFNDKYVFEMMLDTGATITALTQPMANTLQLKPEGSIPIQTPSHELIYLPWSKVTSIKIAGIVSKNADIIISPSLPMGLLGQNFFGIYDVTIKQDVIEFRER
ncbi:MAG: TIGR02281 family clan AA aspartic protease [Pleurocapsa sp.]